jgi:hypothetical protein
MKTKKKYSDKSPDPRNWTTKKLKLEAMAADDMIYNQGCYGMSDLYLLQTVLNELSRRGIEPKSVLAFD